MKRSRLSIAVLLGALLSGGILVAASNAPRQAAAGDQPARLMALTFDDLPYAPGGRADDLAAAARVTTAILRTLAAHRAPAVAFVNEGKLTIGNEVGARTALLEQWVEYGAVLGNHTYSHADFNALDIEAFRTEIAKGDIVSRRLMQGRRPYQLYFRHPQTHTGDTAEKKDAIERFLAARHYAIAPHTIDSADFVFNVGYGRSVHAT